MDLKTSFFLDIRLFGNNTRVEGGWYSSSKVVDSDYTNFKDFVDDILHSYPSGYNDVVKLFYLADESHVEIRTNQDLLAMFAKHESSRVIHISIGYFDTRKPHVPIPDWNISNAWEGPYVIKEVTRLGSYRLCDLDGIDVPNSWHIEHLIRFYL